MPEAIKEEKEAQKQHEAEESELKHAQALANSDLFQLCAIHRLMFSHLDGLPIPVSQAEAVCPNISYPHQS